MRSYKYILVQNLIENILFPLSIAILIFLLFIVVGLLNYSLNPFPFIVDTIIIIPLFFSSFIVGLFFKIISKDKLKKTFSLIQKLVIAVYNYFFIFLICFISLLDENKYQLNQELWNVLLNNSTYYLLMFVVLVGLVYISLLLTEKINIKNDKSLFNKINSKISLSLKLASMNFILYLFFVMLTALFSLSLSIILYFPVVLANFITISFYTYKNKKEVSIPFKLSYSLLFAVLTGLYLFSGPKFEIRYLFVLCSIFCLISYFIVDSINSILLIRINKDAQCRIIQPALRYSLIFAGFIMALIPIYLVNNGIINILPVNIILSLLPLFVVPILFKFLYIENKGK
jgi:hypothetical protein